MDIQLLKHRARLANAEAEAQMSAPWFRNVVAWFVYLGLLRHSSLLGSRHKVTLAEALKAGEFERRILEILPACLINLPEALVFTEGDIPPDLAAVLRCIRGRESLPPFRGVDAAKYSHWLQARIFETASRRLYFRRLPRDRRTSTSEIGATIRTSRIQRGLTQQELASRFALSLRVIRDLEQGKMGGSLESVIAILAALDHQLAVS